MQSIGNGLRLLAYAGRLLSGFVIYLFSKKTPTYAYYGMVGLFCLTGGRSNDFLSRLIRYVKRPYRFGSATGVLGDMGRRGTLDPVVRDLRERGYHIFAKRIPDELCDRLLRWATTHPCTMRAMDGMSPGSRKEVVYHRGVPQAVRYEFDPRDLLKNSDVQLLLADLSIAAVAQAYLGSRPVGDVLGMWWNTNFSDRPDSEAAQYFHFDMDRVKWLKFFIYITDVKPTNGPHSFIAGSHATGGISPALLNKGYVRLMDEEVDREFGAADLIEFSAPRGTIIAEDTRGLHKGKLVTEGDRLVLQLQLSNSLFGATYPEAKFEGELRTELRAQIERYPGLYAAYL